MATVSVLNTSAGLSGKTLLTAEATLTPKTTSIYDVGTPSFKYRDLNISRNALIGGTLGVTGAVTTGALSASSITSAATITAPGWTDNAGGVVDATIYTNPTVANTGGLDSVKILVGHGTPEAVYTAYPGSLFMRVDGGASTSFYVKTSGTGNTGWTAK